MKRVGLKQEFHGESGATAEGSTSEPNGIDEITLDVVGGTVSFISPNNVPDDQVIHKSLIERYLNCMLKLENGTDLLLWINAGACGVDVRMDAGARPAALIRRGAYAK